MDKQILKSIILERQREAVNAVIVQRDQFFERNTNYVLVGVRRAGKSYLLYQDIQKSIQKGEISEDGFLYINFEDERLGDMQATNLGVLLDCYHELFNFEKPFICLDEVQQVEGWEKFVRRLADQKYKVMVTGSNAKMLSREIAGALGGRFIPREIYPFSFSEYLRYQNITLHKNWVYDIPLKTQVVRLLASMHALYFRHV